MKKNLLEHIIKTILFEQSENLPTDSEKNLPDMPIRIVSLVGQDKEELSAAGAQFGFDIKIIKKRYKGKRLSDTAAFRYVTEFLKKPEQKWLNDYLSNSNYTGIASYDFRESERVLKYRIWIFERTYWDTMLNLPYKTAIAKSTIDKKPEIDPDTGKPRKITGLETVTVTDKSFILGNTRISFFDDMKLWGPYILYRQEQDNLEIDPVGLKSYGQWYDKVKLVNKRNPTPDFQFSTNVPNVRNAASSELRITGDTKFQENILFKTLDGATRSCIISYYTDSGLSPYSADEAEKSQVTIYITGMQRCYFLGQVKKINETTFELVTGKLRYMKLYSESSKFKDYEFNGSLTNGVVNTGSTVKVPGKDTEISIKDFEELVQAQTSKK